MRIWKWHIITDNHYNQIKDEIDRLGKRANNVTWHVDLIDGDDTAAGTSPLTALKSIDVAMKRYVPDRDTIVIVDCVHKKEEVRAQVGESLAIYRRRLIDAEG